MYESFFGFREKPFNITPDPRFLYLSRKHREALAHLIYGIKRRKGLVVLSGEPGTGKTTLIRTLLERLDRDFQIAYVFNPDLPVESFLRTVCEDFKLKLDGDSTTDHVTKLHGFLQESREQGKTTALFVDEAQCVSPLLLDQIRVLTSLGSSEQKHLQVLLVGQPELNGHLDQPELNGLAQRTSTRYQLFPLNRKETEEYIRTRLRIAGARGQCCFTERAMQMVYEYSGGVPRVINNICDSSLLSAYAMDKRIIDAKVTVECASDLRLNRVRSRPRDTRRIRQNLSLRSSLISAPWPSILMCFLVFGILLFSPNEVDKPQHPSVLPKSIGSIFPSRQQTERGLSVIGGYASILSIEAEQMVQDEPSSPIATAEEIQLFIADFAERYNQQDIRGFLSLFSSRAIQNGRDGFDDIGKVYSSLFRDSRELRCQVEDMRIDIIEIYQNAFVTARCEMVQIPKQRKGKRVWKGDIRWVLVRENGDLRIRYVDYDQ